MKQKIRSINQMRKCILQKYEDPMIRVSKYMLANWLCINIYLLQKKQKKMLLTQSAKFLALDKKQIDSLLEILSKKRRPRENSLQMKTLQAILNKQLKRANLSIKMRKYETPKAMSNM